MTDKFVDAQIIKLYLLRDIIRFKIYVTYYPFVDQTVLWTTTKSKSNQTLGSYRAWGLELNSMNELQT